MRPLMLRLRDQLYEDTKVIWDEGQLSWAPWSPAYAQWRATGSIGGGTSSMATRLDHYAARRGGASISDMPFGEMMDLTGRLRRSLTEPGGDNIARMNRRSITFGTAVEYASHATRGGRVGGIFGPPRQSSRGGGGPPYRARRPVDKYTEAMRRKWRRIVEKYSKDALS